MHPLAIAAFASGRGSNFAALIEKIHHPGIYGKIVLLICDNPQAGAIDHARAANIPVVLVSYKDGKPAAEAQIRTALAAHHPDLLVLCGFMRLLSKNFAHSFNHRIINIHPSLLPAFPGLHAQRQAVAYGVKISGCTVHFVDEGMDTGPIILQTAVPVLPNDTEDTLSARILAEEHQLFPQAVQWLSEHWPPEMFCSFR